ncbi:histidine kinase [Actinomadura viridis]|uniref:histidine kinase n=1 Tax=Actinomadura viridis TaxID=58110 RepID=A0A931DIV5_9ACTN|nr:histidine kinase [Actinomadura viridis]MBG6089383.1 signal transduction histidine kinase [Actinomadura viridis]
MLIEARVRGVALDALVAAGLAACAVAAALVWPGVRSLDAGGGLLLAAAHAPLAWRRRRPGLALTAVIALMLPFHLLQYQHHAAVPAEVLALFTFAVMGRRVRTVLFGTAAVLLVCAVLFSMGTSGRSGLEQIGVIEAVVGVVVGVQSWRVHRARMAAVTERAERAERTREEEARRRVAEERLRIARDLHDLLAHSITVIGVRAGAAAHAVHSGRPLDRAELAGTLDAIAATCRDARAEVRATLQVLREPETPGAPAPPPGTRLGVPSGVAGIPELAEAARAAGLRVVLEERGEGAEAPEVGIVAYRIVQEALTNVVKHARAGAVRIVLHRGGGDLLITVADDGRGPDAGGAPAAEGGPGGTGFGIVGMAERARSVGGTVETGPGADGGFVVRAVLPLNASRRISAR